MSLLEGEFEAHRPVSVVGAIVAAMAAVSALQVNAQSTYQEAICAPWYQEWDVYRRGGISNGTGGAYDPLVVLRSSDLRPFGRGKLVQGMERLGVGVPDKPLPRIG